MLSSVKGSFNTIGIFGGTFDPIHCGHLRSALEIYETLNLDEMRLIPGKHPPHRTMPNASPEHRLNMVRLALEGSPLKVDDREMHREGPSYSIDTLMSLRKEYPKASLCMVVGVDAFLGLTTWFQWEKLIQLANIIVMYRTGWTLPNEGPVAELMRTHGLSNTHALSNNPLNTVNTLNQRTCGCIITQKISALDIAASNIRNIIANGKSPAFLIPEKVNDYIQKHNLYGYEQNSDRIQSEEMTHV